VVIIWKIYIWNFGQLQNSCLKKTREVAKVSCKQFSRSLNKRTTFQWAFIRQQQNHLQLNNRPFKIICSGNNRNHFKVNPFKKILKSLKMFPPPKNLGRVALVLRSLCGRFKLEAVTLGQVKHKAPSTTKLIGSSIDTVIVSEEEGNNGNS